jgi:hypothetical protein
MEVFMKSKIATVIFSIAAWSGFCDDTLINQPSANLPTDLKLIEKAISKKSFGYVRLGVSDKDAINTFETIPGIGLGYRYGMDHSAIDVSANYTSQIVGSTINDTYFYTAPKVTYLRYWSEDSQPESVYYGAGLGFGGVKKTAEDSFIGLMPNATVGYEMNRNQTFHSFVQLEVSQPVTSLTTANKNFVSFANLPGPLAEVSVGLGF